MRDIADLGLSSEFIPTLDREWVLINSRIRLGQQLCWSFTRDCEPVLPAVHGQSPW
jgi:hypothetical protein